MKILYFNCFSGISGDMTLSALIDLGIDKDLFINELNKLGLEGWEIVFSSVFKHGIGARRIEVIVHENEDDAHHHHHHHHHRNMTDIIQIIDKSGITHNAKELAKRIFMRLAIAEAKTHGTIPDKVHFHEVGAVDSIIDIVGTAICIDILQPDKIMASTLHDGYGFVECQHGMIPVPVPAVTEVLSSSNIKIEQLDIEGEMITPTGAAIIAELSESFGVMPQMRIIKTGYGAGKKDFPIPNLLRIIEGEALTDMNQDTVTVIETNIDDSTPEIIAYTMEKLFEAGARDVFFTPVYMKKCRPATMITIICDEYKVPVMEDILYRETSTIGVRKYRAERTCLPRKTVTVSTPYGEVKAKETGYDGALRVTLEYDDASRLAREKNIALREIFDSLKGDINVSEKTC
ncbi:MAG: nickel pincer cofactor biosynthesis protein LarC [Dysgonamonadaceae bacterium]|jgi:uncharacterized protein (TIGR00299 family) protein|nr:nickel pincer cofactor biosynthesis protein LarC [Dysgonamonadaceae bacterium]